ncbi:lymphocyte antigen 6H-like [Echinops telfairi]|uniref:Lymphocyte antigen 6H-like n=1 Tax=Echinops telfairi TaxID=9371 RepID=A0ABM0IDP4_ECHTE|nr:lymphocyte antigen 6H-like [Echinops telfairi]
MQFGGSKRHCRLSLSLAGTVTGDPGIAGTEYPQGASTPSPSHICNKKLQLLVRPRRHLSQSQAAGATDLDPPPRPTVVMRGAALLLIAALIHCQQHALALQCYTCIHVKDSGQCVTTSCSDSQAVCYTGTITMDLGNEGSMKVHHKGCSPSCEGTESIMQDLNKQPGPEISKLMPNFGPLKPRMKVEVEKCCQQDLCNGAAQGARSLGALAAGLLLSLGVALLCTHL